MCSESCVGRIRYLGVLLYDADKIEQAASVGNEQDLYQSQLDVFLDPNDPLVQAEALKQGIPQSWIDAAQNSPVYRMAVEWKVAFPLHPEYRTLPMVWYIPPLSPIQSAVESGMIGKHGLIPEVKDLRIPLQYLANLLTAGKEEPILNALETMLTMRRYMRQKNVPQTNVTFEEILDKTHLTGAQIEEMYQIMAIANYEDRFVVPTSHKEYAENAFGEKGACGFTFGNGCSDGTSEQSLFGQRKASPVVFHGMRKGAK